MPAFLGHSALFLVYRKMLVMWSEANENCEAILGGKTLVLLFLLTDRVNKLI